MLRIRLRKPGRSVKRRYHYTIVVIEGSKPRDSRFIKQIGRYAPTLKRLKIDIEAYEGWVKKGAKASDTVASLFKRYKKEQNKSA